MVASFSDKVGMTGVIRITFEDCSSKVLEAIGSSFLFRGSATQRARLFNNRRLTFPTLAFCKRDAKEMKEAVRLRALAVFPVKKDI